MRLASRSLHTYSIDRFVKLPLSYLLDVTTYLSHSTKPEVAITGQ
jgi:hypothetical protein